MKIINFSKLKIKIITILAVTLVFTIPFWFIFSNSLLEPLFAKILQIRHDPSMSGGPLIASFYDETNDDNGDGSYEYPYHDLFSEKNLSDIIGYEVYRPLIEPPIWQVAIILSKIPNIYNWESGISGIQIAVFIDIDSKDDIDSENFPIQFEQYKDLNLSFQKNNKPNFMILIDGLKRDKAKLIFNDGEIFFIDMILLESEKKIYLQIPLNIRNIQKILDGRETYHYVFSSIQDPLGVNGWLNIRDSASLRSGGGLKWEEGPKIFDLLAPIGFSQKDILSINNTGEDHYIILQPIKVNGFNPNISYLKEKGSQKDSKALSTIQYLIEKVKEEEEIEKKNAEEEFNFKLNSSDDVEKLYALFGLSRFDEAKILVKKILEKEEENPIALAYYGSLVAMEGGKTKNPMLAISLVQKAYIYLDKAVDIILKRLNDNNDQKTIEYAIIVLTNRAVVSSSVPNEIFSKYEIAISDLIKISELLEKEGKIKESANALMQAAILYEKLNKKSDAMAIWLKILGYKDKLAKVELELVKRNYYH